ncbi:MAG: universal stress protein [Betaproteobacteria bacterium]|nr:universal stress protein [Betaproteobacteria bacterium]
MLKLLVPVDGSESANRAVDHLIDKLAWYKDGVEVHLLNVQHQLPYGGRVESVLGHEQVKQYHHDEGMAALKSAMQKLDAAKVKYHYHIGVGDEAETIARYARDKRCDQIVMGTRGMGSVSNLLLGSVATKVIHLAEVPVLLVK